MWTNLVVVKNYTERKVEPENYTEESELAGVKFIRLEHNVGASPGEFYQRGFQRIDLYVEQQGNKVIHRYALSKNRIGEDADGMRRLVFRPDKRTGVQMGYVPDTPFNRKRLVSHYYHGACWIICDPTLDAEIKAKADVDEVGIKHEEAKKEGIADLSARLEQEREEKEVLQIKLDEQTRISKLLLDSQKEQPKIPKQESAIAPKPKNKGGRPRKVKPDASNAKPDNQPVGGN